MNFNRTKLSASNNGTIFCKTYTDISEIKSSYFVITPPPISEIRQNDSSHHTIQVSSNHKVVQKSTGIGNTIEKGMLSFQRTCSTDIRYISTYLSYIRPLLQEHEVRPSVCKPNISTVNLPEVQPGISNSVIPTGTLHKYFSTQCRIKEHTDALCIDNSNTSKIRKLHIITPLHLAGSSAMSDGMSNSLRKRYEQDNMVTYPTYHENRLRKYKSPVQVALEKFRWLCNILFRPTKHHRIITVGDETDSQTTCFDTQISQSITNTCGDISTYRVFCKYIYKPDTNSELFLEIRQNALSRMKGLAIKDSPDIRQPIVKTPYVEEPNMTCNPMLNIGRNVCYSSTDKLSLLLYAVMKTSLEKQIFQTRRAIAEAKKAVQDLKHLSVQNEGNRKLIIRASEEPRIIHAPTNMMEIRLASSYNNTPYAQQQQHVKEKQGIPYSIDDQAHVTDENICTGNMDITRVSESTPEKTPRIWSIFNRIYNMHAPGIFTSLKNILRPRCTLRSTKSSKNKIKHTSVEKQAKHTAKAVREPKTEYEWTIFYPTHGDIKKKGGLSYLLHYKEIKKQVTEKPQNARKDSVCKKTGSLPVENKRATISGSSPLYTSNHYFVVHLSNSENELTAEDENLPMPRDVNVPEMNKITRDSIFEGKSTTFFKTYQDLNINALLRFQYYYRQ